MRNALLHLRCAYHIPEAVTKISGWGREWPSWFYIILQTNTYQAVIISNGLETFAVFIYNCDLLNWIGRVGSYASIGFSVQGESNDFTNFANSIFSQEGTVRQTACSNVRFNVSYTTIVYRVGVAGNEEQRARSVCFERAMREQNIFRASEQAIQTARSQSFLQDCPCTTFQAFRDNNFNLMNEVDEFICFVGSIRFTLPDGKRFVYRCCYSRWVYYIKEIDKAYMGEGAGNILVHWVVFIAPTLIYFL